MAKFGSSPDVDPAPPVEREVPRPTPAPTVNVNVSTSAPVAETVTETEEVSNAPKVEEHWMKAYWRPAMGWLYMAICACDFIVFPIISMFMPVFIKNMTYIPWKSITLDNGGLIHLAFGAILGVTAYGRTLEKKTGTN